MKNLVLYTGIKDAFLFHISFETQVLSHEELKDRYYKVNDELYDLKIQLDDLKRHPIVRLLIWLKLIKI